MSPFSHTGLLNRFSHAGYMESTWAHTLFRTIFSPSPLSLHHTFFSFSSLHAITPLPLPLPSPPFSSPAAEAVVAGASGLRWARMGDWRRSGASTVAAFPPRRSIGGLEWETSGGAAHRRRQPSSHADPAAMAPLPHGSSGPLSHVCGRQQGGRR